MGWKCTLDVKTSDPTCNFFVTAGRKSCGSPEETAHGCDSQVLFEQVGWIVSLLNRFIEGYEMLLDTETGMVNVFIEPQFFEVSSELLLTIQVSDFATFKALRLTADDNYQINLNDEYFPFVGYGHNWSLGYKLGGQKRLEGIPVLSQDFSPPVKGFKWKGLYIPDPDLMPEEGEEDGSETHVGYCLPGEIAEAQFGSDLSYEVFHLSPLFREPSSEQLKTVFSS